MRSLIQELENLKSESSLDVRLFLILNREIPLPFSPSSDWKVFFEPRLGFSHVRNRALEVTPIKFPLIFIDDDAMLQPEWLISLLSALDDNPNSILGGPFLINSNDSKVLELRENNLNQTVSAVGSGNMLIPPMVRLLPECYFDLHFNEGGEDTDFCWRLGREGVTTIKVDTAYLTEFPSKRSFAWQLKRSFRRGIDYAKVFYKYNSNLQVTFGICRKSVSSVILIVASIYNFRLVLKVVENLGFLFQILRIRLSPKSEPV